MAEAAGYSAVAIFATAWLYRRERRRRWFWCFMAAILSVHVLAVCTLPWPVHYEINKGDLLFGLGDMILTMVTGGIVARLNRENGEGLTRL